MLFHLAMIALARFRSACDRRLIPANAPVQRQAMKRHKGSQKAFCRSSIVCFTRHAYEIMWTVWKISAYPVVLSWGRAFPWLRRLVGFCIRVVALGLRRFRWKSEEMTWGFMELKLILLLRWSYRSCMDLSCVVGMIPFGRKFCKISISETVSLQTDLRFVCSKITQFTQITGKWHPKWSRSLKMTPSFWSFIPSWSILIIYLS